MIPYPLNEENTGRDLKKILKKRKRQVKKIGFNDSGKELFMKEN